MVFNNAQVIQARLFGQEDRRQAGSPGRRVLDRHQVLAHIRASKAPKPGTRILVEGGGSAEMLQRPARLFELAFAEPAALLERVGHMPLPPISTDRTMRPTAGAARPSTPSAPVR